MPPGTTPEHDVAALGLHSVRETALGAYLDLCDGEDVRASTALDAVLNQQYHAPGRPWDGTFRVTAEQADPPGDDAVEWFHYDPNWRQFLGVILAMVVEDHAQRLDAGLVHRLEDAVVAAVRGEPEDRIPDWYTNPNLLHAWLQSWVGCRIGDAELTSRGTSTARRMAERLERLGDVDEYNSPTYDGIDLFAAGLWCSVAPEPTLPLLGRRFLEVVGGRLARLYAPRLHAICGPHVRAYGLDLTRYVSLAGLWLAIAGEPANLVLPADLDARTVHVHDLFFLPLFERVAAEVVPFLVPPSSDRNVQRRHVQRFGEIVAESHISADTALGAERGRTPEFSEDQYVPVTVHTCDEHGATQWLGVQLAPTTTHVDGWITGERSVRVEFRSDGARTTELLVVSSEMPVVSAELLTFGCIRVEFDPAPHRVATVESARGHVTSLTFDRPAADAVVSC